MSYAADRIAICATIHHHKHATTNVFAMPFAARLVAIRQLNWRAPRAEGSAG